MNDKRLTAIGKGLAGVRRRQPLIRGNGHKLMLLSHARY